MNGIFILPARGGHRIKSWNKLSEHERRPAALEERFRSSQDARFRVNGDPAEKTQQPPPHAVSKYVEQRVSYQHRRHSGKRSRRRAEDARCNSGSACDQRQCSRHWNSKRFRQNDEKNDDVPVVRD
jgi:hypothetical protein